MRSLNEVPGSLPRQMTSFVGRDREVAELVGLVGAHELVTLTGVGGVGKTRLAVQVAAELAGDFPDGVWLVELGPVGDPAAVPDAVATALGVTTQAGLRVAESIAEALSGRRMLVVVDNCEHVLDAAADVVETLLARGLSLKVMATSREGLRVGAEHLWPVPSLGVSEGAGSAAVELFVERARAVAPRFSVDDPDDLAAVAEICGRLDGIALAIELAAARMVSMNPAEVRDLLGDRFRLLSGSRRGLERHQTLRHAVAWSYDLLDDDERMVLNHASVFAGGFDLGALVAVCDSLDKLALLDVVDSLVRKSLITADSAAGRTRYGLLETIRSFAEEQLAATAIIGEVRDRHARFFAGQAVAYFDMWEGPDQRVALDWVDVEFANLRAGFRWAVDEADLVTAAAIAAHTALLAWLLMRYEPVGWAEEILAAATDADVAQLPRLYSAAGVCFMTGRHEAAVGYAQTAIALESDPRYDPFEAPWSNMMEGAAIGFAFQYDRVLEIFAALAAQPGTAHVVGLGGVLAALPSVGRADEAMAIAEETLAAARAHANPHLIAMTLYSYGLAFAQQDPTRALRAWREGLAYAREHRILLYETVITRDAAELEAAHGDFRQALSMFDTAIDSFHRAGGVANLAMAFANLAVFFDRLNRPQAAATVYGTTRDHPIVGRVVNLPTALEHLRAVLGETTFERCVATGAAMEVADAVAYARHHIQRARHQAAAPEVGGA